MELDKKNAELEKPRAPDGVQGYRMKNLSNLHNSIAL